jgi:glycosyltransferase involved in cell wall biosynthesis
VIIPVLNGEAFIVEALTSVLSQLDREDEIVVVDDGSTDRTRRLLHGHDDRVLVIDGPRRGPSAARNAGLGVARGALIAFLDHDDLWPPGRHRALLSAMEEEDRFNAAAGRIRTRSNRLGCRGPTSLWMAATHPRS